jgi:hypothetical protein
VVGLSGRLGLGEVYVFAVFIIAAVVFLVTMVYVLNLVKGFLANSLVKASAASEPVNVMPQSPLALVGSNILVNITITGNPQPYSLGELPNNALCVIRFINGTEFYAKGLVTYNPVAGYLGALLTCPLGYALTQSSGQAVDLSIYLPRSDGGVVSVTLYMGHVIAYAIPINSTYNEVIAVDNSTGWVFVNGTRVPPHGSTSFIKEIPSSGVYTLSVNGIINEIVPAQRIIVQTASVPVPPQCINFRVYYDNGSLIGFNSAGASSNAPNAGSNPSNNIAIYGTAMITNNVLGATAPIHYSSEMIITAGPPEYAMWIYYASGYSINASTYNSFAATIYPTLYTPNETMYFVFVEVSNSSGNYVYASILSINYPASPASNYEAPGSYSTSSYINTINRKKTTAIGAWFQTLLAYLVLGNAGDYGNVIIVHESSILENTWQVVEGMIPSNVGSSADIVEVGFGTFFVYSNQALPGQTALPGPPNGPWYPGSMYIDYLCVG